MYDPFDASDALIRDLRHVRVTRHASREGRLCRYEKSFKPEGLGDAVYWVQRENEFLLDFALKNLRYVVQLASVTRDGDGLATPVVESVVTLDAGVTIEDWLRVQPRYANGVTGLHPFQHAGMFLGLLRACLVALREIHRHGIVHCDIKEDNICLPYAPYPFQPNQPVGIDYERIRLIDFAFSVTPERPLECPLPILPKAPYQSNLLKTALQKDRSGKRRGRLAAQDLDYRADLYSLGYLAGRILETGLLQPAGTGGTEAMDGAHDLVEWLKACDGGRRRGKALPHDELIGDIDRLLGKLGDLEAYRRFEVARVRGTREFGANAGRAPDRAGFGPTPLTPLAAPDATPMPAPRQKRSGRLSLPVFVTVLLLAGGGMFGYWKAVQTPSPQTEAERAAGERAGAKTGAEAKADAAAKARAESEAKRKARGAGPAGSEDARWAAENEARLKAEMEAEIRAEARRRSEAGAESQTEAGEAPSMASAAISYPVHGEGVGRVVEMRGTLDGLADGEYAFLVIRSTAQEYGRLYYSQGELPHASEWVMKGVFGTPNYEYEIFVAVTGNPNSADLLRAPRSRSFGLKSLPDDTRIISRIVTVRRLQ